MPELTKYELYCLLEESLADEREGRVRPAEDVFAEILAEVESYKEVIAHKELAG